MQYLRNLDELYAAAVANLGPMDLGSFAEFQTRAAAESAKFGILNPKLVIDIKLLEPDVFGVTDQPYPIREDEWRITISDSRTMAAFMPRVFVVDGDKYTAPI